ncbi:MAG: GNAT family N-acetyltransferase [Actinomycetota bacterium]|nr:GNAT family N-acetyltransferase [Actinomycetota bacterium]
MAEVRPVAGCDLAEPLKLLEASVRDGEPVPPDFIGLLQREVERGSVEVLAAHIDGLIDGVAVLAFRPSVSAGGCFASVEELYVRPEARRRGVGRALLEAVERRCSFKGLSYIEVQTMEEGAAAFYREAGYEPELGVRVLSRSVALREAGG